MENKKNNQLSNITFLRVITTLLVILGHSTYVYTGKWLFDVKVPSTVFSVLTNYIYTFHMPLFVFISGYLYYYQKKEKKSYRHLGKFTVNKFKRLVIPYLIFSTIYLVPIRYFIGYYKKSLDTVNLNIKGIYFEKILLAKDPGHLWFLLMIFGVFLIFYLFEKYINSNIYLNLAILVVLNIVSIKVPNILQIKYMLFYLIYFYIGYLFREYKYDIQHFYENKYILLKVILLQLLLFYLRTNITKYSIKSSISIILGILGIVLMWGITIKYKKIIDYIANNQAFKIFDRNSFSIYLFHDPIIYVILNYISDKNITPLLLVMICFSVSLSLSVILSELLRRIGLGIIFGEKKNNIL